MITQPPPIRKLPLPNFFVIGAAKSGTTALWHAICQHPDIHLSPVKEPMFFLSEGRIPEQSAEGWGFLRRVGIWRSGDYVRLFASSSGRRAIGEASTAYLPNPESAARIHARLPDSRIIAVLRQPADRAYSAYHFLRQKQVEPCPNFEDAMADQGRRRAEGWAPHFLYEWYGYYHAHLQPWFGLFPKEQIRVFLYDDWRQEPQQMLSELFRFLGVDEDFEPILEARNVTSLPRYPWFYRLVTELGQYDSPGPERWRAGRAWARDVIMTADTRFNRVAPPRMDPAQRAELTRIYRDDILKLGLLLDRDLSHWLAGS